MLNFLSIRSFFAIVMRNELIGVDDLMETAFVITSLEAFIDGHHYTLPEVEGIAQRSEVKMTCEGIIMGALRLRNS